MENLIINFTPTGMIPTKEMTPYVPVTANEIVDEVLKAREIGLTLVHLHARNSDDQQPTHKTSEFQNIVEPLRKYAPELVLCLTLSGRSVNTFEKRSEIIELYPDMGSLTLSSLNFSRQASVNSPQMIQNLAQKMKDYGVKPELEVFDLGMINYAKYLIRKNLIKPPYYFNVILGNIAGMQCNFESIGSAINQLPKSSYWALGGIGKDQLKANAFGIVGGGGVRVGLEDNIFFDANREKLCSNLDLLKRIHELAETFERTIMTSKEFGNLGFYNPKRKESIPVRF